MDDIVHCDCCGRLIDKLPIETQVGNFCTDACLDEFETVIQHAEHQEKQYTKDIDKSLHQDSEDDPGEHDPEYQDDEE